VVASLIRHPLAAPIFISIIVEPRFPRGILMKDALTAALGRLDTDMLMSDFEAICDTGGRFAGTDSENQAVTLLKARIEAIFGKAPEVIPTAYDGWRRRGHRLRRLTPEPAELDCISLVWSPDTPAGGLEAEVVDMGRGAPDDIRARAAEIKGRIPLVRHEYMFTEKTLHRRFKYEAARDCGAAGFLIAGHIPGGNLVSGSSGRNRAEDIPAAAITFEGAEVLAGRAGSYPNVRLELKSETVPDKAENLVFELPGETDEWIVLSAHIDGHPLAESAMDNGTGLAVVLAAAHALSPQVATMWRGLRVMLFNVEEWGLWGSAQYADGLAPAARDRIALNVNLDSVGGDSALTAITSGYPKIGPFLQAPATAVDTPLGVHDALMRNSDHYNFARNGIPAFRLVAGFDDPNSNLRYVLTPGDTRDKVTAEELERAARLTTAILVTALSVETLSLRD